MPTVSFTTTNDVARVVGYQSGRRISVAGWMQADAATNDYFRPLDTFAGRFDVLLTAIRALGFGAVDLWSAHLNWCQATDAHIAQARALLERHALTVSSITGSFGETAEEFAAACRLAVAMGTTILGGTAPLLMTERHAVQAILARHGVRLGIENHPGLLTTEEVAAAIGDGAEGTIGVTIDTGWFATAGVDAVAAINTLADHVVHVHLKDVRSVGGHLSCRYGDGCVPIEGCVRALQRMGYDGGISVEHEPFDDDPGPVCRKNRVMLEAWLASA